MRLRFLHFTSKQPFFRQRFNALDLVGELQRGTVTVVVAKEWLAPVSARQPTGTMSQRVRYFKDGEQVAIVHQYVQPDGSMGGSGLPDPKWLRDGDRILKIRGPS